MPFPCQDVACPPTQNAMLVGGRLRPKTHVSPTGGFTPCLQQTPRALNAAERVLAPPKPQPSFARRRPGPNAQTTPHAATHPTRRCRFRSRCKLGQQIRDDRTLLFEFIFCGLNLRTGKIAQFQALYDVPMALTVTAKRHGKHQPLFDAVTAIRIDT